jgi:hypothetical protein
MLSAAVNVTPLDANGAYAKSEGECAAKCIRALPWGQHREIVLYAYHCFMGI